MKYTVYKITNNVNGKIYIGKHQTNNLNDGYMGSGKLITRAIKKYGKEKFTKEILYVFNTQEEMNDKEKELVEVSENTYNLCPGGQGGFGYINGNNLVDRINNGKITFNSLKNIYGINSLAEHFNTKQATSKRLKELHSKNMISIPDWSGKHHTKETKEKMSLKASERKGKKNSQYGTCWITNGINNKKIKKEEINFYLILGYYKGRKIYG